MPPFHLIGAARLSVEVVLQEAIFVDHNTMLDIGPTLLSADTFVARVA